jgi:hypothetical protein
MTVHPESFIMMKSVGTAMVVGAALPGSSPIASVPVRPGKEPSAIDDVRQALPRTSWDKPI